MSTLERVFVQEFKKSIRYGGVVKNIFDIPLPSEVSGWNVSGCDLFAIKGIDSGVSGLFSGLNGSLVRKLPKNVAVARRKIDIVKRDFARDENGRFIYEDVSVPTGSMVVVSEVNLSLPFRYKCEDKGFGYIDFVINGKKKEFLYYVPKTYLYAVHQTALALSVKNMKNFSGKGYQTWSNGVIYLHVIPYNTGKSYVGSKILKTGYSLNYGKEVRSIIDYWMEKRVIPNISLCNTVEYGNLVLKDTVQGYDSYVPVEELSLGDKIMFGDEFDSEDSEVEE